MSRLLEALARDLADEARSRAERDRAEAEAGRASPGNALRREVASRAGRVRRREALVERLIDEELARPGEPPAFAGEPEAWEAVKEELRRR